MAILNRLIFPNEPLPPTLCLEVGDFSVNMLKLLTQESCHI
jgi:hypothetical protein